MKKLFWAILLLFPIFVFAQAPSPLLTAPPVTSPVAASNFLSTLTANWALIVLILKSVLDLVFLVNPKADAPGGVLDAIYQFLKSRLTAVKS